MKKILFVLVFSLSLIAGCEEKPSLAPEKPVVKIGIVYPMTGNIAKYGQAAQIAADIFFEEFNKYDHKFIYRLIWENNQGKPALSNSVTQKLIQVDKVNALVSVFSHLSAPIAVLAERYKIPHLSASNDPSIRSRDFNFSFVSDDTDGARLLQRMLLQNKAKSVVMISLNAAGMLEYNNKVRHELEAYKNIRILDEVFINPGERDFRILIQKINRLKPDYIVMHAVSPELDIFMRQMKEQGISIPVTGMHVFLFMHDRKLVEGAWHVGNMLPSPAFLEAYITKAGTDNTEVSENMFGMLAILTHAYETAGTADPVIITDIISGIKDFQTPVGKLTADPTRLLAIPMIPLKVKGGKIVPLED